MADFFNPLNPRNDLSCPNIHACISQTFHAPIATEEQAEAASEELARLREVIKAQREQMERTERAMVEYAARDKAHVDKLCDIRAMIEYAASDTSDAELRESVKDILKKYFGFEC
jgi:septal ring factor EnvC (AmiA/AmiB activator)